MVSEWNTPMGGTWKTSVSWCVACGAALSAGPLEESTGAARCRACSHLLQIEVAGEPTTAFLTRFERPGPSTSRSGDPESGLCRLWLDLATGETHPGGDDAFLDPTVPLVPCVLARHDGDAHAWDRRSWRATVFDAAASSRPARPLAPRRTHRPGHVDGREFRELRERLGLTQTAAAALYLARWGRGGTTANVWVMEHKGGSSRLLQRAFAAYHEKERA